MAFDITDLVYITLFSGAGGMIIPFLFELFTGRESFSAMQIFAVIIRLIAIILPIFAEGKNAENKKGAFLICWILFVVTGISTVLPKLYSEETAALGDNTFCFWTNIMFIPSTGDIIDNLKSFTDIYAGQCGTWKETLRASYSFRDIAQYKNEFVVQYDNFSVLG